MLKGRVSGAGWTAVLIGLASVGVLGRAALAAAPPVVPGYERLRDDAKAPPAQLGQVLLGELNCAQCHVAPPAAKRILTKGAPDLSDAGARLTPQYLRKYIANPHAAKPGATMPDLFHASDPQAAAGAVDYIVNYLVSLGGPIKPADEEGGQAVVEAGQKLFQTVGCLACHAPQNDAALKSPSIPLPVDLAAQTTVDQFKAFLLDPVRRRPGSRMPKLGLSDDEARQIAVYLLRDQMTNPQLAKAPPARVHGVQYDYYETAVPNAGLRAFSRLVPQAKGHLDHFSLDVPNRRGEEFAIRFTASISIPRDGKYTFYTTSDDGSRLYVNSRPVVNNDGDHSLSERQGSIDLTAGEHPVTVTYYQRGGDAELKVEWSGPGLGRQEIARDALFRPAGSPMIPLESEPFTVDPQKAEMGGRMFAMIGCASCHAIPKNPSTRLTKPLAELDLNSDTGCLGTHVGKGVPNYDLTDDQRQAIKAALSDRAALERSFDPQEQVIHTMAAMNCFACHVRGGVGGPTPDRNDAFVMTSQFDMGDEGRVPPRLDHAGQKLLPQAMDQIIFEGKLRVRPVLATRMPIWGRQALGQIVDAFQQADQTSEPTAPAFSEQGVKDGRQLVGINRGLGCVNCHSMNGVKSLGMPGPDLGTVHERIKFGWFHQWLDNPPSLVPATRMPQFWPGHVPAYKDVADGTEDGQVAAMWTYMSLGRLMALPAGLVPTNGYELVPSDAPIVHRTFMAGVGPRAVLVGFPEMVHVAFDADGVRLAKAWRGKFFDARGMWEGRGGGWLGPLGTDVIDMPGGPSFAFLEQPDTPWPVIAETQGPPANEKYRNVGGRFKGYELDKQERPTFHYVLNGVDIHEQPVPVLKTARAVLVRKFTLSTRQPVSNLYFLAATGKKIEQKSPGVWLIDDKLTITLSQADRLDPRLRDSVAQKQLLVPLRFVNGEASFDVEISW